MYASLIKNDGTFGGGNPWTASVELKTADSTRGFPFFATDFKKI